ncbi:MAG TPA: hypothetical protein PLO51_04850, partial [Candidatus Micrarchaeota archaeon]|nr:hypothetical protein [Candidatus Micrarchaeota archaeon]
FRTLLFGLTVRCASMLEGAAFNVPAMKASGTLDEAEISELEAIISAKRNEVAMAQWLLQEGMLARAFSKLAKSKSGLAELAEKLDGVIENRLK